MSKRAARQFDDPLDFVPTPPEVVEPLGRYLAPGTRFHEPCAGDGRLAAALESFGHICVGLTDANPRAEHVASAPVSALQRQDDVAAITNPPWARALLVPLLGDLLRVFPEVWLLQPLDHLANQWMNPFRAHISTPIIMVGRVRWVEGSPYTSKENAAWVHYTREPQAVPATIRFPKRRVA